MKGDIDMEWLRSITGKKKIRDEDLNPIGSYPFPLPEGFGIRELKERPKTASKDED